MLSNDSFIFTKNDLKTIKSIKHLPHTPLWRHWKISNLKRRIKKFHLKKQKFQCCYCRKSFKGEFSMVIDIEHILPKSKYKEFIFDVNNNLTVSCKRCNMNIKNDDISFMKIKNKKEVLRNTYFSKNYKFIHPNIDDYFEHMKYTNKVDNDIQIVKYTPKTQKGKYTYKYFKLKEIETSYIDKSQGIKKSARLSRNLRKNYGTQINDLMKRSY